MWTVDTGLWTCDVWTDVVWTVDTVDTGDVARNGHFIYYRSVNHFRNEGAMILFTLMDHWIFTLIDCPQLCDSRAVPGGGRYGPFHRDGPLNSHPYRLPSAL